MVLLLLFLVCDANRVFLILEEHRVPHLFQIKGWRFLCSCMEVLLLIRWAIYGKQEFMRSAYPIQILLCSQQQEPGRKRHDRQIDPGFKSQSA